MDSEDRKSYLGASDAAAALGLSKWKTPVQLWMEKTGDLAPDPDNLPMRLGRFLEPFVLELFQEESGLEVMNRQKEYVSYAHPWRRAHLDGMTPDGAIVESKTAGMIFLSSSHGWGEPGTDDVPDSYLLQAQHQLSLVPEAKIVWMPVLLRGDFRIYRIERNDDIIRNLVEREAEFWELVENRIMPRPVSLDDIKALFPNHIEETIVATDEILTDLVCLASIKKSLKKLREEEERTMFRIAAYMKEKAYLIDQNGEQVASFKSQNRKAYSVKESQSRVFRIKTKGDEK